VVIVLGAQIGEQYPEALLDQGFDGCSALSMHIEKKKHPPHREAHRTDYIHSGVQPKFKGETYFGLFYFSEQFCSWG